jgi:mannose/fructose/sorbose-specific phosphotransferase system IIB component
MDIQLTRIDDRLIHGQVVVGWVRALDIQRLVVVNDVIAKNAMQKTLMEMAVPSGLKVGFFTVAEAAQALGQTDDRSRTLLLFSAPSDVLAFLEKGAVLASVNVGGMHFSEGKRQICKVLCVNDEDVAAFKALAKRGVELEIRAVPGDLREPLAKYLPELKTS